MSKNFKRDVFGMNNAPSSDTTSAIRNIVIIGENPDIDSGTLPETMWEVGGEYVFPTAASTASVVSDSANDTSAGTGARYLLLEGLDTNWKEVVETITLTGTTPAVSTNTFFRVNSARVVTSGSGLKNAGNITVTVNSKTVRYIAAGESLDHTGVYSVPADHTFFLTNAVHSIIKSTGTPFIAVTTKVFVSTINTMVESGELAVSTTPTVITNHELSLPRIPEKSDLFYNIEYASTTNINGFSTVRGLLVYKSYIPRFDR